MKAKVVEIDSTSDAIKSRLASVGEQFPTESTQAVHKIAVLRWFADALELDEDSRKALGKQWKATPSGFGCNDSQLRQKLKLREASAAKIEQDWN